MTCQDKIHKTRFERCALETAKKNIIVVSTPQTILLGCVTDITQFVIIISILLIINFSTMHNGYDDEITA